MAQPVIVVDNLSKIYQIGQVGTGTLSRDLQRWISLIRGKEDPALKIGKKNILSSTENDSKTNNTSYVWALRNISFEVNHGEILGIIGKNGAGKSTLLKILSQVTSPTKGLVKVKGRIASLLEVGTGFHPDLTGRENVYLNGAILGMTKSEIRNKFDEIVEFSGVEKYIDTPIKRYSSGMYVRLAFAVAAHLEPDILVVDEVLAVGDAEFQQKAIGKMQDVSNKEGRTILFVSHNMAALQNLCSSAIILKDGLISLCKSDTNKAIEIYLRDKRQESKTKISERTDRKGEQNIKITDICLLDDFDKTINIPYSGQIIKVKISFKISENLSYRNVAIAFSITRSDGVLISVFTNELTNQLFTISQSGSFICNLGKMPLMNGLYSINIMINRGSIIEDWLIEAFFFEVVDGDFYGTGRNVESTHKGIFLEQNWEVTNK
jgi:lipopolysaccharide transport system ATP-binding protein